MRFCHDCVAGITAKSYFYRERLEGALVMVVVSGETCTVLTRAASRVPMTFRTSCDIRARGREKAIEAI